MNRALFIPDGISTATYDCQRNNPCASLQWTSNRSKYPSKALKKYVACERSGACKVHTCPEKQRYFPIVEKCETMNKYVGVQLHEMVQLMPVTKERKMPHVLKCSSLLGCHRRFICGTVFYESSEIQNKNEGVQCFTVVIGDSQSVRSHVNQFKNMPNYSYGKQLTTMYCL